MHFLVGLTGTIIVDKPLLGFSTGLVFLYQISNNFAARFDSIVSYYFLEEATFPGIADVKTKFSKSGGADNEVAASLMDTKFRIGLQYFPFA